MADYRVEFLHGKNRRLYAYSCAWCGSEFWKTQYAKRRFCSKQCIAEDRRSRLPKFDAENEKYCSKCKTVKTRGEFRANASRWDGLQVWCLLCESKNKARWYKENVEKVRPRLIQNKKDRREEQRKIVWEYLVSHPCVDCGEKDPVVLDFDHVSGKKKRNVSMMLGTHTSKAMMKEISKCVIRCSNCHRRKTAKERHTWRSTFGLLAPM